MNASKFSPTKYKLAVIFWMGIWKVRLNLNKIESLSLMPTNHFVLSIPARLFHKMCQWWTCFTGLLLWTKIVCYCFRKILCSVVNSLKKEFCNKRSLMLSIKWSGNVVKLKISQFSLIMSPGWTVRQLRSIYPHIKYSDKNFNVLTSTWEQT